MNNLCEKCPESNFQPAKGAVDCEKCPTDYWSSSGSTSDSDCFALSGMISYVFGNIGDSKVSQTETSICEIRPNALILCPSCTCNSDSRNGFWDGPICNECRRGFANRYCTTKCPGYDGTHDSTICNGNGKCWYGKTGTGLCYCGGLDVIDNTAENVVVDVRLCPKGRICPGYGPLEQTETKYIPIYYVIQYRQFSTFVLQINKYTPERGHMWFKRYTPSKAYENKCAVCLEGSETQLTRTGYWNSDQIYNFFEDQSSNGFHGENCQHECGLCLHGGKCANSPHPYVQSYTILDTFVQQRRIALPQTTCICSSTIYDSENMCCPNGFRPYIKYGYKDVEPYHRFSDMPYLTSIRNEIRDFYVDKDLWLESDTKYFPKYEEPSSKKAWESKNAQMYQVNYQDTSPYNKHIFYGTSKELCRPCPGLYGKGVRLSSELIESKEKALTAWWDNSMGAFSRKCNGIGVCDFYAKEKERDVNFMGDATSWALLEQGKLCNAKSVSGFQAITTLEECIASGKQQQAKYVAFADEFYFGGQLEDMVHMNSEVFEVNQPDERDRLVNENYDLGYASSNESTVFSFFTAYPRPDTNSRYKIFPKIVKKCIVFEDCDSTVSYFPFNIYDVQYGFGDDRLQPKPYQTEPPKATFDRFDTCFTYTKETPIKMGLFSTIPYSQGEDPFLGGLCPKGYFCSKTTTGIGFKEACPPGYYQPYEGITRTSVDVRCSTITIDSSTCQLNLGTKNPKDYVDKVCLRCPQHSYSAEGSYECTECSKGRVKKISGDYDIQNLNIMNMPTFVAQGFPTWYYIENEMGNENDDCALVPPGIIHVPQTNFKMHSSTQVIDGEDWGFLPVFSCPFGYTSRPGTYVIEDKLELRNILNRFQPVLNAPYFEFLKGRDIVTGCTPCRNYPQYSTTKYIDAETIEECRAFANTIGINTVEESTAVPFGCSKSKLRPVVLFNDDVSAINTPSIGIEYLCNKVEPSRSIMQQAISYYCSRCPGNSVTGSISGLCTTCFANQVKMETKTLIQSISEGTTFRFYEHDTECQWPNCRADLWWDGSSWIGTESGDNMKQPGNNLIDAAKPKEYELDSNGNAKRIDENTGESCFTTDESCILKPIPDEIIIDTSKIKNYVWKQEPVGHYFNRLISVIVRNELKDSIDLHISDCITACAQLVNDAAHLEAVGYTGSKKITCACQVSDGTPQKWYNDVHNEIVWYKKKQGPYEWSSQPLPICASCGPGQNRPGGGACQDCNIGRFTDSILAADKDSCKRCNTGYYQNEKGKSICKDCPTGQWQDEIEKTSCKTCPEGWHQDKFAKTTCIQCQAGRFANVGGLSTCTACPMGWKQPSQTSTSCLKCDAGYFSDVPSSAACKECQPGTYADVDGLPVCKDCPEGRWLSTTAGENCELCGIGRFWNVKGRKEQCPHCVNGKYQTETGQTTCHACPGGQTCNRDLGLEDCPSSGSIVPPNIYASSCTPCTGPNKANSARTACEPCTGLTKPNAARDNCEACEPGQYIVSNEKCKACTGHTVVDSAKTGCVSCSNAQKPADNRMSCLQCGDNQYGVNGKCLDCSEPGWNGDISNPFSSIGYGLYDKQWFHSDSQGPCFFECPDVDFDINTYLLAKSSGTCTIQIYSVDDEVDVSIYNPNQHTWDGVQKHITGKRVGLRYEKGAGSLTFDVVKENRYLISMNFLNIEKGGSLVVELCDKVKAFKSGYVRTSCL